MYRPVCSPCARSSESIIRAVDVLPLVPVRWIDGYARCGLPEQVEQRLDPVEVEDHPGEAARVAARRRPRRTRCGRLTMRQRLQRGGDPRQVGLGRGEPVPDLRDHRLGRLVDERRRCRAWPGTARPPSRRPPGPSSAGPARRRRRSCPRVSSATRDAAGDRQRRAWPRSRRRARPAGPATGSAARARRCRRRPARRAGRPPAGSGCSPWSERNRRTSVTTRCSAASSASAASSISARSAAGQAARDHRLAAGQRGPQLLGDERDDRVQQPQQLVEHVPEHPAGGVGRRRRRRRAPAWPARRTSRRRRPRRSGRARRRPWRTRTPRTARRPRR